MQSVKLSTDIYSKMTDSAWDGDTLIRGSELLLVGAGYGRNANSALDDTTVPSDGKRGTIHFGSATTISKATYEIWDGNNQQFDTNDYPMIEIVAEAREGATSALTGDSGSGMFFEYEGDFYLVGTTCGLTRPHRQAQLHSDKLNPIWNIRQNIPIPMA